MVDIQTEMVQFPGDGDQVPGYLARPTGDEKYPGIVLIQEWWGLDNHIKDLTRRFAGEGFAVVAPDLYRGVVADEPDEARKLVMELEKDKALADIQGAVDYLRAQPYVEPKKIGVIGFCMGGYLAMWMAIEGKHVGASVVFYGGGIGELSDEVVQRIQQPVLGIYGSEDHGIPVKEVQANEQKLRAAGKTAEMIIYEGAGHAFFNDTRAAYDASASQDAWERTRRWFHIHLK